MLAKKDTKKKAVNVSHFLVKTVMSKYHSLSFNVILCVPFRQLLSSMSPIFSERDSLRLKYS